MIKEKSLLIITIKAFANSIEMEYNFNQKKCRRKTGGKNPNAKRKSNGPKPLSNREFIIIFRDKNPNHIVATNSRDIKNNLSISMECTISQITITESSTMELTSSEIINIALEDLIEVGELTTICKLLEE